MGSREDTLIVFFTEKDIILQTGCFKNTLSEFEKALSKKSWDDKNYHEYLAVIALTIKHENDISITYQRPTTSDHPFFASPPIQLIKPMKEGRVVSFGSMKEILSNFDFTVIRAGLLDYTLALVDADFIHDEGARILRLKNIHCPISSTLRCMKYARKGYWLPPFNCIKLFLDWDGRDDNYRIKLIEFLDKANDGEGLTQKDIDELEALMRID